MATKKKAKTNNKPKSLAETLKAALAVFNGGKNWIKGEYDDGEGHYCALGAIQFVDGPFEQNATELLDAVVRKHTKKSGVIDFNDSKKTTFADVKKMFTLAINAAKKHGKPNKKKIALEKQLKQLSKLREKTYEQAMALENQEYKLRDQIDQINDDSIAALVA